MTQVKPTALDQAELINKYKLPKMNVPFDLPEMKGEKTGLSLQGQFVAKILTLDEETTYMGERDMWLHRISGGKPELVSDGVATYINARSYLKQAIVEAPDWWWDFADNPLDMNIIVEVYLLATEMKKKLDEALFQDKKEAILDERK